MYVILWRMTGKHEIKYTYLYPTAVNLSLCTLFSQQTQMNETGAYKVFTLCIRCLADFKFLCTPYV